MRQNFEFALGQASGDYVIFFGDDDGILPGQFAALRALVETRRPDVLSWRPLSYAWPAENFTSRTGALTFEIGKVFGGVSGLDAKVLQERLLACRIDLLGPVPILYHGCAARNYIDRLRSRDGVFFNGSIPDIYFSYRALLEGGDFLLCNHPFSINASSPASTGYAQHAYAANDERSSPAHRFNTENETDPVRDVVGYALSIPLLLFSTLETVRARFPLDLPEPDYVAWYRYVLSSARSGSKDVSVELAAVLDEYAARSGTVDALAQARRASGGFSSDKWKRRMRKWMSKARRFRQSASFAGDNTILTAATVCDTVLGDDLLAVHRGELSRSAAWRNAVRRTASIR